MSRSFRSDRRQLGGDRSPRPCQSRLLGIAMSVVQWLWRLLVAHRGHGLPTLIAAVVVVFSAPAVASAANAAMTVPYDKCGGALMQSRSQAPECSVDPISLAPGRSRDIVNQAGRRTDGPERFAANTAIRVRPPLSIPKGQFGSKWGKHAMDYGLDPGDAAARAGFMSRIRNVHLNPDEVNWAGSVTMTKPSCSGRARTSSSREQTVLSCRCIQERARAPGSRTPRCFRIEYRRRLGHRGAPMRRGHQVGSSGARASADSRKRTGGELGGR